MSALQGLRIGSVCMWVFMFVLFCFLSLCEREREDEEGKEEEGGGREGRTHTSQC